MQVFDLWWLWLNSNSYPSWHKFSFGHATQVDTSWSQVICICMKFTTFCDLRIHLAMQPLQVRTQILDASTCMLTCASIWPGHLRWLYRVFLAAPILGTNMSHGKTKMNKASLILKSFFGHSFLYILKIQNITSFYSVSCGPLSHVRSRQKLRSFQRSLHMLLDHPVRVFFDNFECEQSAPKLPPLHLLLGIATTNATCAENEDSSF